MTAAVLERAAAVCAELAAKGIVVTCTETDGALCVHVDSPRPEVGPVDSRIEAHTLHALHRRVPVALRWVP